MVKKASWLYLSKLSYKQLKKREDRLQAEAGRIVSQMRKLPRKSKQYKDLQKRGKIVSGERTRTIKYKNIKKARIY